MFLQASVSHSVHSGKGVSGRHPPPGQTPPRTDTPLRRHSPLGRHPLSWADTPSPGQTPTGRHPPCRHPPVQTPLTPQAETPAQTPPAQCMLGYTPPPQCMLEYTHPPPGGHCNGRYASYWNAFSLTVILALPSRFVKYLFPLNSLSRWSIATSNLLVSFHSIPIFFCNVSITYHGMPCKLNTIARRVSSKQTLHFLNSIVTWSLLFYLKHRCTNYFKSSKNISELVKFGLLQYVSSISSSYHVLSYPILSFNITAIPK